MRRYVSFALVATLFLAGCYKQREEAFRDGGCTASPIRATLQVTPSVLNFTNGITSDTVEVALQIFDAATSEPVDYDAFAAADSTTRVEFDFEGRATSWDALTAATFSVNVTAPGLYRPTVAIGTCAQPLYLVRETLAVRASFAPELRFDFLPDPQLGAYVGQLITAYVDVVDRDGSTIFDLWYDPDGPRSDAKPIVIENWNIEAEPRLVFEFKYSHSGLFTFEGGVTDQQGDTATISHPAIIGLLSSDDAQVDIDVTGRSLTPMPGSAANVSETVWGVATGTAGVRFFAYSATEKTMRSVGHLLDPELGGLDMRDMWYQPGSKTGMVLNQVRGLYAVDLSDPAVPVYRRPVAPVGPADVARYLTALEGFDSGRYLFLTNRLSGRAHILRSDPVQMGLEITSNTALSEAALCQITGFPLNNVEACDCPGGVGPCPTLLQQQNVGHTEDAAWVDPMLALAGADGTFRVFEASESITGPKGGGDSYSWSEVSVADLPVVPSLTDANRSVAVTGTRRDGGSRIEWFVAHGKHGLAMYHQELSGPQDVTLPADPYANFSVYRLGGLLSDDAYDTLLDVAHIQEQVLVADEFGSESALLTLDPLRWYSRPATSGGFSYRYADKCDPFHLRMDDLLTVERTYITDCSHVPTGAQIVEATGDLAGILSNNTLRLLSVGAIPPLSGGGSLAPMGSGTEIARVRFDQEARDIQVQYPSAWVARGTGGIEKWDLRNPSGGEELWPTVADGIHDGASYTSLQPVTGNTIWALSGSSVHLLGANAAGRLGAIPARSFNLPREPVYHLWQAQRLVVLGLSGERVEAYSLLPGDNGVRVAASLSRYDTVRGHKDAPVIVAGWNEDAENKFRFNALDRDTLLLEATFVYKYTDRVPYYAVLADGRVVVVESTFDADGRSLAVLHIYVRNGNEYVRQFSADLPVNGDHVLRDVYIASLGPYLFLNLKGNLKGLLVFSEAAGPWEFVGSSLGRVMANMDRIEPFYIPDGIGVIGYAQGGVLGGQLNIIRYKLSD